MQAVLHWGVARIPPSPFLKQRSLYNEIPVSFKYVLKFLEIKQKSDELVFAAVLSVAQLK